MQSASRNDRQRIYPLIHLTVHILHSVFAEAVEGNK